MADETKTSLYNAINALHQTDQAIWRKVQAVSGTIGLENLPEDVAKIITTEGKIAKDLLPQTGINLSFNGKQVGTEITSLNFAGTTTITVDKGVAKIQIGDNMNSSIFGEAANSKAATGNDGTHTTDVESLTSIIIPDATGADFKIGDWEIGTSKSVGTTATEINAGSTGWIHFNEGTSDWTVTVYGESKNVILAQAQITTEAQFNEIDGTFIQIAQSTKWIVGKSGISLTLEDTAREDNYPSAVGARGKVTFAINVSTLVPNGGRFSFE